MYCVTVFVDGQVDDLLYFDELGDALDCKREYQQDGFECLFQHV